MNDQHFDTQVEEVLHHQDMFENVELDDSVCFSTTTRTKGSGFGHRLEKMGKKHGSLLYYIFKAYFIRCTLKRLA